MRQIINTLFFIRQLVRSENSNTHVSFRRKIYISYFTTLLCIYTLLIFLFEYFWSIYLSLVEINSQYQMLLIYNYLEPVLSKLLTQRMHVNIVGYRFIRVNLSLLLFRENKIC